MKSIDEMTIDEMKTAGMLGDGTCLKCGVTVDIGYACAACAPEFRASITPRGDKWIVSQSFAGLHMQLVFDTREQADALIAKQRATHAKHGRKFVLDPDLEGEQERAKQRLAAGGFGNGSSSKPKAPESTQHADGALDRHHLLGFNRDHARRLWNLGGCDVNKLVLIADVRDPLAEPFFRTSAERDAAIVEHGTGQIPTVCVVLSIDVVRKGLREMHPEIAARLHPRTDGSFLAIISGFGGATLAIIGRAPASAPESELLDR